ncbi:unnamed protein product [Linum trigynum]|uniref:Replication protein A OB domain-containing protein n=1 Tax=Linum trigynum TaxID=586398 RepID=A0AAV2D8L7_9ROSI
MNHILLSKLSWTDKSSVLKLRFLHSWAAGNPAWAGGFTERATLWTNELGLLVQSLAPNQLSVQLDEVLAVGNVYFMTQFSQHKSRKQDLHAIASLDEALVDVVGRLVSPTPVGYVQKQNRSIKRQTIVIQNERETSLSVTLWEEFVERLVLPDHIQMDGAAPVIVAFTSLNPSIWRGTVGASNSSVTRIVMLPPVP